MATVAPVLLLFVSRGQRRSQQAEALLARTLARRGDGSRFRVHRVELERRPDLFERFRVDRPPALLLIDRHRIRGRVRRLRRPAEIDELLASWAPVPPQDPPGGGSPRRRTDARLEGMVAHASSPLGVLVVDDSAPLRRAVVALLELDGRFTILAEAGDGAEGVRLAERHAPDCVLLDLEMPVLGGLAALSQIKRRSPRSKVVVFSGFDGDADPQLALAAGADVCLVKPSGLPDLAAAIVDVCAGRGTAPSDGAAPRAA